MARHARVIINPQAGGERTRRRWKGVVRALREAGFTTDHVLTEAPGHATELARESAQGGYDTIIAVGGDGTVFEAVNGVLSVDGHPPFAVLQTGSGNAVRRALGFPRSIRDQANALGAAKPGRFDVGWAEFEGPDGLERRAFLLVGSLGFGARCMDRSLRYKRINGMFAYSLAMVQEGWSAAAYEAEVVCNGEARARRVAEFMAVNAPSTMGTMSPSPTARADDGLLDLVTVEGRGRRHLYTVMGRFAAGKHIGYPGVTLERTESVRVAPSVQQPVQLDGEIVGTTPVTFSVEKGGLNVLMGPGWMSREQA